jgi:UPF0176 protein
MNNLKIKNVAFYAFFTPTFDLGTARGILHHRMGELNIKGTILLGPEGINCSISGNIEKTDAFLEFLFKTTGIAKPEIKTSFSKEVPFKRIVVKLKPHIVAKPGKTPVDLTQDTAPYISPEDFHQWIKDNKKMVVLDTRNAFENKAGRFKDSFHLGTKHFADFEEDLQKAPLAWQSIPIVTFCTGGIRCEKAAPLMLKKGFQEVYQLEGGILNYFKKVGRGYFEGECFVFDQRIALDEALSPIS